MSNKVNVLTNVPEIITFKFNTWKRWENTGKNGNYVTYSIGVSNRGEDKYFSVYEREYDNLFSKLGNLQDRTIEILKYEDGKYKNWKIMENGVEITPKWGATTTPEAQNSPVSTHTPQTAPNTPQQTINSPQGQFLTLERFNEVLDKQRAVFRKMEAEIKELRSELDNAGLTKLRNRIAGIETILESKLNVSKEAIDLHQSFDEAGMKPMPEDEEEFLDKGYNL